jgi:hypothetical protein
MSFKTWVSFLGIGLPLVLLAAGCKPTPPPITAAQGTVLLNGKPLPGAMVEFVPELKDFGAEMNSKGVTDEKGHFSLTCTYKSQEGAAVGKHRVVVTEGPAPEGTRGMDQRSQERYTVYVQGLKNRPIPPTYGSVGQTPLRVEVKPDQQDYTIELTR